MKLSKQIGVVIVCLLSVGLLAQPVSMKNWRTQSADDKTGVVIIQGDQIELIRGKGYPTKSMLRAYQDISVTPGTVYQLSYKIKVEGAGGGGRAMVYLGTKAGVWSKERVYAQNMRQCDFTAISLVLTATDDIVKFRIDFRAFGVDTKVTYKNINFEVLKKERNIILTPTTDEVKFDGYLSDPLWRNSLKLAPFRVLGNIRKTTAVTNSVRLAVKDGYLYVGYQLEEPNIKRMKLSSTADVSEMENPIRIAQDDCVETFFTVDKKSSSHLIVNPAGVKYWEQINVGVPNQTWYPTEKADFLGDWDAKSVIGKKGWTVEMRIKLSSLFGENVGGRQTVFANFTRHRPHTAEANHTWAAISGSKYKVLNEFPAIIINLPPIKHKQQYKNLVTPKFTKRFTVPELILAGKPVKLIMQADKKFQLGEFITFDDRTGAIKESVQKLLTNALKVKHNGKKIDVTVKLQKNFESSILTVNELKKLASPEAFKLNLIPGKAVISGSTDKGILRGIATLIMLANRAKFLPDAALPALTLYDAPRMPFRGWLISHSQSNVKQMIDLAYLLRFNKIFISLHSFRAPTPFPFASHPIGNKRYTKQHWIDIFNYARERGIEPIPYFSPWGRVIYYNSIPGGTKLFVEDRSAKKNKPIYRNLDVANSKAVQVALELQKEIIDTLKPKGFCIGMDEIHFGHTVSSAAAKAKKWKPSDWFVNAIKYSHELFECNNVKMYIWGDMIDPGYNGKKIDMCGSELMARLPKDITILDWKYDGRKDYTADFPSIKMFKDGGFKTIGSPWYKTKNTPRMAHAVVKHQADGMNLTCWHSTQIDQLKPELIRSLGLLAYYSWSPEDCNLKHLSILPDLLVHAAAYWNQVDYPAKKITTVSYTENLVSGDELAKQMGFPVGNKLDFIATPFKNYRGVGFEVFKQAGQPAAIIVTGSSGHYQGTVKNGKFSRGLKSWLISNRTDGSIDAEQETLKITAPSDNAFMRAFQDIKLNPNKQYMLRYRIKVKGTGYGRIWAYMGDDKFKWDTTKIVFSNVKNGNWKTGEVKLPAGGGSVRISLNARGKDTIAWFDNIELVEAGESSNSSMPDPQYTIPINSKAKIITFMHATNKQSLAEDLIAMGKKFKDIIPGRYIVNYDDGNKTAIPLSYRENICAVNDNALGLGLDLGLFGTVGERLFVNLPTFTWVNPVPNKTIKSIEILPGNSKDMSLLLFGISLD
jgi:Glycosyl hydrolase family 20, catalytic domain